ncbi:hypothetical protein Q1695_010311 [Nippostrongylus brasiliensis]|nr:hypothetical protein Q1695_010311 [Nippostrongylus brasiliensis]
MVALVALIVVLLPSSALVRTAVIEKASAAESPKEYYERIKNIPVDEITQEVEDISSDDGILKMLRQNPLLKGLAMFNEREVTDERWSSPQYYKKLDEKGESKNSQKSKTRSPLKRQKQKSLYDNFYEDYEKMNETYFNDGTSDEYEIRRTPTGRKLSDDIDESLGIEYDDEQPFAVTESLVKSLERANEAVVPVELDKLDGFHASFNNDVEYYGDISTGIVTTTQAPPTTSLLPTTTLLAPTTFGTYFSTAHISPPLANDEKLNDEKATTSRLQQTPLKKKVLPAPGLKKSEFQGVFYVVGMNNRFEVQKQAPQQLASILQKSHRSEKRPSLGKTDSMIVTPQKGGTFLVSGTRYYSDNRVDGEVHHAEDAMREKYRKRRTSKEELEMIKDPLYAVEVELSGMKSRKSGTTSAMEGTKLQSGKKKKKRSKKKQPEDAHDKARSTVTMMKVGEKVFEKRITDIGGHKVVVALGNKHLHGADLIARPGSVIHGRLPTGDEGVEALEKAKVGIRDLLIFPPSDGNHNHVDSFHNSLEEISDLGGSLLVQSEDALELPKELQFSDDKTLTKAQIEAEMIEMCFFVKTDTQLVGAAPIERTVGVSSTECIMQCAR